MMLCTSVASARAATAIPPHATTTTMAAPAAVPSRPAAKRRLGAVRAALAPPRRWRGEVMVMAGGSSGGRGNTRSSGNTPPPLASPGVRRAWPGFKLHEQQTYVFIDGGDVIETLDSCYQGVSEAQKLPVGNLLTVGDEHYERVGSWKAGTYINVLFDEEERLFKMWYNVSRKLSDQRAEVQDALAYATSLDGLRWEKPLLHLHEVDGSSANNLVFPFFRWATGTGVYKDPVEQDPERRYKMLFMLSTKEMSFAGISQPVCIAYSADGVHWDIPKSWLNPVISKGTDTQICLHWDQLIRRYVVYLRGRPNIRVITMAESEDCVDWTERKLIVSPDAEDPPQNREFYGMSSMQYRDWRVGFLSVFHVLYESWVALNPESVHSAGVDDKDDEWMNTMDIQLVCSTDGRRYRRVGAREPILRVGAPRTSDAGYVYPPNAPFIKDGEVYLYYAYGNELHGNPPRHGMPIERGVGLAKIPRDRLVCIKQEHTAQEAVLTTVPLVAHPTTLRLNLDTSTDGASCAIELCDPFGRTLPGFSRADCDEMKGVDATEVCVRWRDSSGEKLQLGHGGGQELEAKMVSQSRGTVKLRVFLNGGARLYAIYT